MTARDLAIRALTEQDAPLLVEATAGETGHAMWGPRPSCPYSLVDARGLLAQWRDQQVSYGVLTGDVLVAAVGVMRAGDTAELAYWVRPESRGQGIASTAVRRMTRWAHEQGLRRVWLEIDPVNAASLRVAERAGYRFEERLPLHCRYWRADDPAADEWHDCLIWTSVRQ